MGFDLLILTDHSGHTEENSVYALASALATMPNVNSVDLASRGVPENATFFSGNLDTGVSAIPVVPEFDFRTASALFMTSPSEVMLEDYDFIFLRLPPPLPATFFKSLGSVFPEDHIINSPSGILHTSPKTFLLNLQELCPPMRMVNTSDEVLDFLQEFPLVLKPVSGYGGTGVIKLTSELAWSVNGHAVPTRQFLEQWSPPYLAMQYLEGVHAGDKRTIVVNGQMMGSALRLPAPGDWVCNVAQGGQALHAVPAEEELEMATRLSELLARHGIVIFGFDTLVGPEGRRVLSEINTMSLGGLKQIQTPAGEPILPMVVLEIMTHCEAVWSGYSAGL